MKTILSMLLIFQCLISYAQEPIIIGLNADISAVAKEGGIAIQRGAEIAIDEINEKGGVLNRPLKLVIKNHRGNPTRGVNNLTQLSKLKELVAVIGGVHTPVALKELPLIHKHKIIYLDPWAAGTPIVDNGYEPNFVFRVSVRDEEAAKVMLPHAKQRGMNQVGLLLERTAWGRSNEISLIKAAKQHKVNISQIAWFNWGQKDFTKEINALQKSGANAIILVANAPEGAAIINNMLEQTIKLPIISHWGIASGNFIERVGIETLNEFDISLLQTYSFTKPHNPPLNNAVLKRYQEKYDQNITANTIPGAVGTAHAYDLVHLLAKAITAAGTIEREQIRTALEQLSSHNGLVKNYQPAFSKTQHDALLSDDYIMSTFDNFGNLVPIQE